MVSVPESLVVAKPGERVCWLDAAHNATMYCTATADYRVIDGDLFRRFTWFTLASGEPYNESWLGWLLVSRRFDQPADTGRSPEGGAA